jgi:hypothetical protein
MILFISFPLSSCIHIPFLLFAYPVIIPSSLFLPQFFNKTVHITMVGNAPLQNNHETHPSRYHHVISKLCLTSESSVSATHHIHAEATTIINVLYDLKLSIEWYIIMGRIFYLDIHHFLRFKSSQKTIVK